MDTGGIIMMEPGNSEEIKTVQSFGFMIKKLKLQDSVNKSEKCVTDLAVIVS